MMEKNLEDLPFELILMIFNYLDVNTLLKCRLLNKKFQNIVENVRLTGLCVTDHELVSYEFNCKLKNSQHFFYTNEAINTCSYFFTKNSDLFKSDLMKTILCKIKKLFIRQAPSTSLNAFNLDHCLNQFENLEILQILRLKLRKGSQLRLKNLKILNIEQIELNHLDFVVDTPKLFAFKTGRRISYFQFVHINEITHIYLSEAPFRNDLEKFVNLKYLYYNDGYSFYYGAPEFTNFKKLEELHFNQIHKEHLYSLLNKKRSKICNFKIYLRGILVNQDDDIEIFFNEHNAMDYLSETKLIALNYSKTSETISSIKAINYTNLITILGGIPDNIHKKLFNILKVTVTKGDHEINQVIFVNFLKEIKNLKFLDIDNVNFDQQFYNELYKFSFLIRLDINHSLNIDLDFILKCKELQKFKINQIISLIKLKEIFVNLKYLDQIEFIYNDKIMIVYNSIREGQTNIQINKINSGTFHNLNSTINFLNNFEFISEARKKLLVN